MAKRASEPPRPEPRVFRSAEEIDQSIVRLERRIAELEQLDVADARRRNTGAVDVTTSNIRETILEVFGPNSPEFREHEHLRIWAGGMRMGMSAGEVVQHQEQGRLQTIGIVRGLVGRLREKRGAFESGVGVRPASYFDSLNLHPRISEVSRELFMDGHHWEAVFAAAKALVNLVKELSNRHDLDGAPLMRTVFSKAGPILQFNELGDQTDLDEQEGMMHLFEGAVLGIRNPGGHSFPEGPEQRAVEYISLLSLLAYRAQEAKRAGK